MKVLKFGGTSVANSKNLTNVLKIVQKQKYPIAIVVSALGGITDLLMDMLSLAQSGDDNYKNHLPLVEKRHLETIKSCVPIQHQSAIISFLKKHLNELESRLDAIHLLEEATPKNNAAISAYGELLSSNIIQEIFSFNGIDSVLKDSRDLITTLHHNGREVVEQLTSEDNIKNFFKENTANVVLLPGFIASNASGETTTLGRGGSDYSAALIASATESEVLEIWTDVSGMYTAHPKIVAQAKPIEKLTYYEAMELSHFGAKVIYPPTLQPIIEKKIPIVIKNTFAPEDAGTLIDDSPAVENGEIVKGISHIDNVALINLEGSGMIGITGFSKRFFEALSDENINVIMITQASSEHSICIGVKEEEALAAKKVIDEKFAFEISINKVAPAIIEKNMVNIAVVGEKMKDHQGISGKLFSSLGVNNINIRAIAQGASERNISIIIDKKNVTKAINTLHESFFEAQVKELNLFVTGVGNVGSKLLEQIEKQTNYLIENLRLKIRVIAISNSKKMVLEEEGLDLSNWKTKLQESKTNANRDSFFEYAKKLNLRNSIFVDNTASEVIAKEYAQYLNNNIGVVTCNKIAAADELNNYLNLKKISRKFGSPYLFETNVGAGLPIIDTLNNLIASGDQIIKIQAVLSGSLNFVFNNFKAGASFHDVVLEAQQQGYTEPDPKIDLSGIDVARKILILARESGMSIELDEIENESFLPQECLDTKDNKSFFESLIQYSGHFEKMLENAEKEGAKMKYVAQLENGKAKVGIQLVKEGHDFYNLEGSDNIILFYTNRYKEQPLIVKGAGAGADVTASGIFADIIRIGKQ
ncbi:MAG: bifunctional aspartate kinase/homoserine dehydrogenase I [Flavobacteriaceae bacterium]|jgi:aspartokinase/homoserine dehydrogenase 1|nr:bifunctional aspartate kinase/homoserine dehydrogenase I [Flavobacteriaceae bacterium]